MHQLPRNMSQHSPIPFRCAKIRVLNIGGTPPYLPLKSTNKKAQYFLSLRVFQNYKKKYVSKNYRHSTVFILKRHLEKSSLFWFSMFKFVVIAARKRMDAPTSKKYVTAQPNFSHMQQNQSFECWEHPTIFALEKYY